MIAVPKSMRVAGLFLANVFAAVMGTAILTSTIPLQHPTLSLILAKDCVAAFAMGYLSYFTLKSATAKWVWIAGLCWFGQRAVVLWMNQSTVRAITGNHATFPLLYPGPDAQSFSDWITYTLIFQRTIFYAGGAFLCSRFGGAAPLDAGHTVSDHDPHAHPAPTPGVREPLRPGPS